jgi:tRNA1Val (adenine37-N6)-methyltransferase
LILGPLFEGLATIKIHKSEEPISKETPQKYQGLDWDQPPDGYRFSEDSVLLAEFAPVSMEGRALDLGCGCGVVGLEALVKGRLRGITDFYFAELKDYFRPFLTANLERAKRELSSNMALRAMFRDWRELTTLDFEGPLDYICCNPPYTPKGRGRMSGDGKISSARTEAHGDLRSLIKASSKLLKDGGLLDLTLPRKRLSELTAILNHSLLGYQLLSFPPRKGASLALIRLQKHHC